MSTEKPIKRPVRLVLLPKRSNTDSPQPPDPASPKAVRAGNVLKSTSEYLAFRWIKGRALKQLAVEQGLFTSDVERIVRDEMREMRERIAQRRAA